MISQVNKLGPEHSLKFVEHTFHLPNTTTIHTHGLHVSPSGIEDNVFRVLYSGQEAVSEYHIRDDHQRTCSCICMGNAQAYCLFLWTLSAGR